MSDKSVLINEQISSSGWKLVPVEPTEEMLNAIFENHWQWPDDADLIVQYRAMLAAAPALAKAR